MTTTVDGGQSGNFWVNVNSTRAWQHELTSGNTLSTSPSLSHSFVGLFDISCFTITIKGLIWAVVMCRGQKQSETNILTKGLFVFNIVHWSSKKNTNLFIKDGEFYLYTWEKIPVEKQKPTKVIWVNLVVNVKTVFQVLSELSYKVWKWKEMPVTRCSAGLNKDLLELKVLGIDPTYKITIYTEGKIQTTKTKIFICTEKMQWAEQLNCKTESNFC